MTHRILRRVWFLCLAVWVAWVSVACSPQSRSGIDTPTAQADCQTVQHGAGEACVPNTIQRLVTLDGVSYEYAIALDLNPIGTVYSGQFLPYDIDPNTVDIGSAGEPSLEKILSLKPDLIVGLESNTIVYDQLAQIAPTVLLPFEHSGEWKERFSQLGDLLGRTEQVRAAMDAYNQRIREFKSAMGDRLSQTVVSVVRVYPEIVNLYLKDSFNGVILQDAGLPRPPSQDISAEEAKRQYGNEIQYSISREVFTKADGDALFIWTGENEPEADQSSQKKLAELKEDPLWRSLNAVQKGAVYEVPSYWIGSGPLSANAVIDDLFKYLAEGAQS